MKNIRINPIQRSIDCMVEMPGSKSYTNRALIIAALAEGESKIISPLHSDDTKYMIESLKKLGVKIEELVGGDLIIQGNGGKFDIKNNQLFVGIAGTTSRFLTALSVLAGEEIYLTGEGKILERPIGPLVSGLKQIGVEISYEGKKGSLPLKINGENICSNEIEIDGSVSSQYFTALMLIAPILENGLRIKVQNEQTSKSYIDMTISIMKEFGIEVENNNYEEYIIKGNQSYTPKKYKVEGDWSSASYFCAIGALNKGQIKVVNLNNNSAQGDVKFPDLMQKMGAKVEYLDDGVIIRGSSVLNSIDIDMEQMPDTSMTLAVVAAFAKGKTEITGLSTLKAKETNRIEAIHNELMKMGIETKPTEDSITIIGGNPKGEEIETYDDHRIAMAFAVAGTKIEDMVIRDKDVVGKSFPEFWEEISNIGVKINQEK